VRAAWTTTATATVAMVRHSEPQVPAAAIVSRQARDPHSGARSRGLFSPRDRARPEPAGRGGRPNLNGEVVSSESPDLIRAWHRARRHQGQALRVAAMRPWTRQGQVAEGLTTRPGTREQHGPRSQLDSMSVDLPISDEVAASREGQGIDSPHTCIATTYFVRLLIGRNACHCGAQSGTMAALQNGATLLGGQL
jgi:hypothetical protein